MTLQTKDGFIIAMRRGERVALVVEDGCPTAISLYLLPQNTTTIHKLTRTLYLPGPYSLLSTLLTSQTGAKSGAPIVYKEDVVLAGAMSRETEVTIVRRANSRNIVYLRYDYAVFGESRVRWTAFPVICIVFLYIGWITKMLQVFFVWPLVRLGQNNAYGKKGG